MSEAPGADELQSGLMTVTTQLDTAFIAPARSSASTCSPMPARTPERGYSGTPLPRKLGIREGSKVAILAEGTRHRLTGTYDVIVFFAVTRAEVRRRHRQLSARLVPNGRLWVSWPRRGSGIATDISESSLREVILPSGLVDNKVAAIDERWSALQFVIRLKDRPG